MQDSLTNIGGSWLWRNLLKIFSSQLAIGKDVHELNLSQFLS